MAIMNSYFAFDLKCMIVWAKYKNKTGQDTGAFRRLSMVDQFIGSTHAILVKSIIVKTTQLFATFFEKEAITLFRALAATSLTK